VIAVLRRLMPSTEHLATITWIRALAGLLTPAFTSTGARLLCDRITWQRGTNENTNGCCA